MYSVLIADDEKKVAQLIETLIDWEGLGLVLHGVVNNGLEALKIIKEDAPDIVVTDIRMPKINGLQLIEQARKDAPDTNFVIISGYRQFEYAHTALKFGVQDYILKPIDTTELNEVLGRIVQAKQETHQRRQSEQRTRLNAAQGRGLLFTALAGGFLEGQPETLEMLNKQYRLDFGEGLYQAVALRLDNRDGAHTDPKQDALVREWLQNRLEKQFAGVTRERLAGPFKTGTLGVFLHYPGEALGEVEQQITALRLPLSDYVAGYEAYDLTIGVGAPQPGYEGLGASMAQSLWALDQRILQGAGRTLYGEALPPPEETPLPEALVAAVQRCVGGFDGPGLAGEVSAALNRLAVSPDAQGVALYRFAREMADLFYSLLPEPDRQELEGERQRLLAAIDSCNTVGQLSARLSAAMSDRLSIEKLNQAQAGGKPVREAKAYISRHYAQRLSLEAVAETVNLNPSYFSVVFKKETGKTFSDYLTEVRMEAAKTLLRNTGDTMAAVAEAVGYRDVKHFSKTFTKLVGIKPTQYRRLYS